MAALTNTVHVAMQEGTDLAEARASFELFGEVVQIDVLPEEPFKVAVVFFDVRSAERAADALKTYCSPGPQIGERFDSEDYASISGEQMDTVEDVLGHAGVAPPAGLSLPPGLGHAGVAPPAGLSLPPGLGHAGVAPPPGLPAPPGLAPEEEEEEQAEESGKFQCRVTISGLPSNLLTEPMMECVLQQAGLGSAVIGFTTKSSKPCGEATVTFSCPIVAEQCVTHFMGCQWGSSGSRVKAEIVGVAGYGQQTSNQAPSPMDAAAAFASNGEFFGEASSDDAFAYQLAMESMCALSTDSFMFAASLREGFPTDAVAASGLAPSGRSALSAAAPAFVPAGAVREEKKKLQTSKSIGSDLSTDTGSTDAGESEDEDEKNGLGLAALAAAV